MDTKRIIINADDFGSSKSVNRGILETIEKGVVTSTSVMVDGAGASEAKDLFKIKKISVGIHLEMSREGLARLVDCTKILFTPTQKLEKEFLHQIEKFKELTGRLPDHIDSHHGIHIFPSFRPIIKDFCKKNSIPSRSYGQAKFKTGFFAWSTAGERGRKKISPESLIKMVESWGPGTYEMMCHPGYVDKDLEKTKTAYLHQREQEVKTLTSPEVIDYFQKNPNISLVNWKEV